MKFGRFIREEREKLQLALGSQYSLRQVAGRVGLEPSYLSKIERDIFPPPSEAAIVRLANDLKLDSDVLLAMAGKLSSDLKEAVENEEVFVAEAEIALDNEKEPKVEEVDCAPGWWDQPTNEKEVPPVPTEVQPAHRKISSIDPVQYPMPSTTSVNTETFYGYPVASMPQLVKVQFIENEEKPEKKPQKKVSFWDRFFS